MKRFNIPFSPPDMTEAEVNEVKEAILSGWITTGPRTKELERQIASYVGTERAVCLNSATACMEMALRLLGIGAGDEVIVPAYTYTASASVIDHVGAKIVFIDSQKDSLEMDYEAVESAINEHTKAIIPVDLAGIPCDYDRLYEIVNRKKAVFAPTIDYYITKEHLDKASELMKVYEEQSGLFDPEGNIAAGREIYYYIKGTYYLKRHDLTLAEQWFRKLPSNEQKNAYRGLLSVFRLQNKYDSIAKYAYLYENALDSLHNQMQTEAIHQMASLYNYQRFKDKAEKEEKQAKRAKRRLWITSAIVVVLLILICLYIYEYRRRKKEEMVRLYSDYLTVLSKYNQSVEDYRQMKEDATQFEKDKQQEVEALRQQMVTYQKQLECMDTSEKLSALSQSDIVNAFHHKAERKRNIQEPDSMEWKNLYTMMTTEVPFVSTFIGGERVLSTKELHVCLLLILGFTNIENL